MRYAGWASHLLRQSGLGWSEPSPTMMGKDRVVKVQAMALQTNKQGSGGSCTLGWLAKAPKTCGVRLERLTPCGGPSGRCPDCRLVWEVHRQLAKLQWCCVPQPSGRLTREVSPMGTVEFDGNGAVPSLVGKLPFFDLDYLLPLPCRRRASRLAWRAKMNLPLLIGRR